MGDFDGVGRIYRSEMNPQPERHPQVDRTDRDKQGKQEHEQADEEPHDTVELHEEGSGQKEPQEKAQKPPPKDRKLDISA